MRWLPLRVTPRGVGRCREVTEGTGRCLRAVRAADGRVIPCAEPKIYAMFQLSGDQRAGNGKCPVIFIPVRGVEDATPLTSNYSNFQ